MKNKKSIIMIVVLLLLVVVSGTMAWLSYQSKKTALVLVLGEDDSFVITIDPYHYKGTLPSSVNYSQLSTYSSVSANNSSVFEENFIFYYRVNEIDEELLGGSLKFAIRRSTTLNGTYTEVASGTFNSSNTAKDYFVFEDTVPAGTTYYYRGYIYIDGSTNNTNLVDKTVNMEFRASFGLTGAQMLINKANDSSITTYTAGDTDEMYTFSQPDTVQLAATTDYRYIGDSPNNYIEFNDEVWRIIGVFDGKIKIIKDEYITNIGLDYKSTGVGSSENPQGSNDWIDAQLMYMLNPSDIESNVALKSGYTYDGSLVRDSNGYIIYQKGCKPASVVTTTTSYSCTVSPWSLNETSLNQVADTIYYLGGNGYAANKDTIDYYQLERDFNVYNGESINWTGKVGLLYPSDFGYSFAYGIDDTCYNDLFGCNNGSPTSSWLHKSDYTQWTITPNPNNGRGYISINSTGSVSFGSPTAIRPVVYLKPSIELTGNGTNDENIYKIVDASKSKNKKALYNVIRIEAASGSGNAAKYTGLDSDTYENDVYYFTGSATNTNVLFANHCWQMIRTTDTGGVKLLYNGTAINGTCNNTGTASQLPSTKEFNTNRNSPAYVGYMYNKVYTWSATATIADDYVYGNSFTYSNGIYTLSGSTTTGAWSSIYNTLSNTHYTCLNNTGTCTDIKYIFYTTSSTMYYITLTGGKSVNDSLNEMLWADDVNETDSTIKDYIDTWYASNMTSYTSYLEDTVYCNDRSIYNLNGWNPNGGSTTGTTSYLYFYSYNKSDLTCTNKNDRFTMSSTLGNGKLTYPVGLMTAGEANLIGSTLRTTGQYYWLGSPRSFNGGNAFGYNVFTSGGLGSHSVSVADGARPVVSLKPGTEYVDGEGSGDDPFLVE